MLFKTGPIAAIQALAAAVDATMSFPIYGTDSITGQKILPAPGQNPATVVGVTLHYASPIVSVSNPNLAAYPIDAGNEAAVAAWVAANSTSSLTDLTQLDLTWFTP